MGRDKSGLRLRQMRFMAWVRRAAFSVGMEVRLVRRDVRPGNGPLGGMETALIKSGGRPCLILSCDMPLVRSSLLGRVLEVHAKTGKGVACHDAEGFGFPWLLPGNSVELVGRMLDEKCLSLQTLGDRLAPVRIRLRKGEAWQRWNVNTPEDLVAIREWVKRMDCRPE